MFTTREASKVQYLLCEPFRDAQAVAVSLLEYVCSIVEPTSSLLQDEQHYARNIDRASALTSQACYRANSKRPRARGSRSSETLDAAAIAERLHFPGPEARTKKAITFLGCRPASTPPKSRIIFVDRGEDMRVIARALCRTRSQRPRVKVREEVGGALQPARSRRLFAALHGLSPQDTETGTAEGTGNRPRHCVQRQLITAATSLKLPHF